MKVLIVNDYGTPTGGAELMSLSLRDGLRARGHDARFFASTAQPLPVPVAADYTGFGTTSRLRTYVQAANPMAARRLGTVLEAFQPDVVHVRMFLTQLSPFILPALRGVRCLLHVVNYRTICPTNLKLLPGGATCRHRHGVVCYREGCLPLHHWLALTLQMKLWERWRDAFDLVVANSHWVRRRLSAEGIAVDDVIWNGVPVTPARAPLGAPPTVAFAGRLVPKKGAAVLLEAMARVVAALPEARLLLAGDGPARNAVDRLVCDLGLASHVTRLGHLPRAELERAFQAAWVQAVPSRWEEPFGLVAAEAMMRGTCVVASDTGGLSELVDEGRTGFKVPPGDADALAAALLQVLRDRATAEAMGAAARRVALDRFSEARVVEQFVAVYHRLCHEHPVHSPATALDA